MKIVNGFELFDYAKENNYILPAYNTTNLEMTYGIVQGLNKAKLPGIVQISSNNLRLSSPKAIADIVREATKNQNIPISLHLDHGKTFEDVVKCVDAGFTSIMIDGSKYDYEENIEFSRKAVEYCHFYNIPVEVELGAIGGKEDDDVSESNLKTDPNLVKDFIERTGCDTLAVSIGNVHGLDDQPKIDFELLEEISKISTVPLVLHGGSGIPIEQVRRMKKFGVRKVNIGANLRKIFIKSFGEEYENNHNSFDVMVISEKSVDEIAKEVADYTRKINRE